MSFSGENIWIIGASSGIGAALARELSAQGATLILSARSKDGLKSLQKELGSQHYIYPLDVSDYSIVEAAVNYITRTVKKLDRVIFMAAIYQPADIVNMDASFAKQLLEINVLGAFYVTKKVLPILQKQSSAQLVLCASVAGYVGLPGGQPYSASKAALINFAESLYAEAPKNVDIKLINPGFVRTPMTDKNTFAMPMRVEPEIAARYISDGLKSKAFEIDFPKKFTLFLKLLSIMPYRIKLFITSKMKKSS
jgi:short-subunit dehydrogenase